MNESIVQVAGGILIFVREGRRLVSVRFVDAAIAHYYMEV